MAQAEIPYQESMELHHPHSWVTKYWYSQDHKVIAIQYGITAMAVGLVALVLSWIMRMQIGFPVLGAELGITPDIYYQSITMHGMIMVIYLLDGVPARQFRQLPDSLDVGSEGHGVPVRQHDQLPRLPAVGDRAALGVRPARRSNRRGVDPLSAPGDPLRHPGRRLGDHHDARVARDLHRRVHHGRPELRHHHPAGPHPGHDADAHAAVGVGHLRGHRARPAWRSRRSSSVPS